MIVTNGTMDLKRDIRASVLDILPHKQVAHRELEAMPLGKLICVYNNWSRRIPPAIPHKIFKSDAFLNNPKREAFVTVLDRIERNIIAGKILWKYLSRRVAKIGYVANSTSLNRDKDRLLNDWGIHHLHLGLLIEPDGFVSQGNDLLFAAFFNGNVFFIDLGSHADFANEDLFKIMIDNWPDADLAHELIGVKGPLNSDDSPTSKQRDMLRKSGVASMVEHNGKCYVPGLGGISSAGTTIQDLRAADFVLDQVEGFERIFALNPDYLAIMFRQNGKIFPDQPLLKFVFLTQGFGVVEMKTNIIIRIDQLDL